MQWRCAGLLLAQGPPCRPSRILQCTRGVRRTDDVSQRLLIHPATALLAERVLQAPQGRQPDALGRPAGRRCPGPRQAAALAAGRALRQVLRLEFLRWTMSALLAMAPPARRAAPLLNLSVDLGLEGRVDTCSSLMAPWRWPAALHVRCFAWNPAPGRRQRCLNLLGVQPCSSSCRCPS